MNPDRDPNLMSHDADGITELDNQLPRWWLWLFILTTVWGFAYLVYFEVARVGHSSREAFAAEMAAAGKPATAELPPDPSADNTILAAGQTLFLKNCITCHGAQGGGLIGPNLCDDYFLHGPTFADSVNTIREGVPAKGMISWKNILRPQEVHAVASYIWKLRGTSPANPRPPQGEQFVPPDPAAVDTNAPPAADAPAA